MLKAVSANQTTASNDVSTHADYIVDNAEMIAVITPDRDRLNLLRVIHVLYLSPDNRIQPLEHNQDNFVDLRSDPYPGSAFRNEQLGYPARMPGVNYLAFLRRTEEKYYASNFPSGVPLATDKYFDINSTVQLVAGDYGLIALTTRENLQESGLVEKFMASINGDWEEEQPDGWKSTIINNFMSSIDAYGVKDGNRILEAYEAYISMDSATDRAQREKIFVENISN